MSIATEDIRNTVRGAKEVLLNEGWGQGDYVVFHGITPRYCTLGAFQRGLGIYNAHGNYVHCGERQEDIYQATLSQLDHFYLETFGSTIAEYNDAPGRTREEVVAALDAALLWLSPEQSPVEVPAEAPVLA